VWWKPLAATNTILFPPVILGVILCLNVLFIFTLFTVINETLFTLIKTYEFCYMFWPTQLSFFRITNDIHQQLRGNVQMHINSLYPHVSALMLTEEFLKMYYAR
jgi:uncharacterized membrane protein